MTKVKQNEIADLLLKHNIKPSYQRMRILEYLKNNRTHPTADHIYSSLHQELPTLSRATVYNTLNLLVEAGLIRVINTESKEYHYDININGHGHLKCEKCNHIHDFDIDICQLNCGGLDGFIINEKNIFFRGICPNCQNMKKN